MGLNLAQGTRWLWMNLPKGQSKPAAAAVGKFQKDLAKLPQGHQVLLTKEQDQIVLKTYLRQVPGEDTLIDTFHAKKGEPVETTLERFSKAKVPPDDVN